MGGKKGGRGEKEELCSFVGQLLSSFSGFLNFFEILAKVRINVEECFCEGFCEILIFVKVPQRKDGSPLLSPPSPRR